MSDGEKDTDYILVLKALKDIPFGVGRKLLADFLKGNEDNESIVRNKLQHKNSFGSMAYEKEEINNLIDRLLLNNLIQASSVNGNRFWKLLELTPKGVEEINNPSLYKRKISFNFKETETKIGEDDQKLFSAFGDFLSKFNDPQKKSIINNNKHTLCIAGAGSGKTTVLTKRIEFLVNYRSIDPKKILAITFTRKARQEMVARLSKAGNMYEVNVETFNSFCEKILRKYNDLVYDKPVRVVSYRDKILIVNKALAGLGMNIGKAMDEYFSYAQKRAKTPEQLANIFMNDCFFVRDYFKFKNRIIEESSFDIDDPEHEESAKIVFGVCNYIDAYMKKHGMRDFADQLIDTLKLFEERKDLVPEFNHVLIDEYQDVNSTQIKLVDILSPENIFCVGDPRQSIFGWRGSDIGYTLNFEEKYPDCEIITLTKNYRSTKPIVELINKSIHSLGLADLESALEGEKDIKFLKFKSEDVEFDFVIQRIIASELSRNEIFVLARTNRQLNKLSQIMKIRKIKHVVRSDEMKRSVLAGEDEITLATIHAIKGMEAEMVFIIGCTGVNFPCKGSEHPVIDMIKIDEYDKEEEERRLFYVAMSRSKKTLYMTYSGNKPTYFLTKSMLDMIDETKINLKPTDQAEYKLNTNQSGDLITRLKEWRRALSNDLGVPAFMILHDSTLIEIAQKTPLTQPELEHIRGLGPTKIMKYGEDILRLVSC